MSFDSSTLDLNDKIILIIKYKIEKGVYSEIYSFIESGWKPVKDINFRKYSERNSYQVKFQVSDISNSSFSVVSGTAWSWYYKQTS